jgi:hypothetical protein
VATYSSPSGAVIRTYSGLSPAVLGLTATDMDTELAARVVDGEDDTFLRIGTSYQTDSSLSAAQVRVLQRAVSHRTAALVLLRILTQLTTGTQEPLLFQAPEQLTELVQGQETRAARLESLLEGTGGDAPKGRFVRPRARASTFDVDNSDRRPSERNALLDESDDRSSFDTEGVTG